MYRSFVPAVSYRQICNLPEYQKTTGLQIRLDGKGLNDNGLLKYRPGRQQETAVFQAFFTFFNGF